MQKEAIKFEKSLIFEGMTSIRAILRGNDYGLNDRQIISILYDQDRMNKIHKDVGYLKAVSEKYSFTVEAADSDYLESITLGNSHGGLVATTKERTIPSYSSLFSGSKFKRDGFYCIIEGIEDPYNFGYAIRSLYACGCDGIILGERNWMSAAGVVARSSAGASEMINIYKGINSNCIDAFKEHGYQVVCAEEKTDYILGETELNLPLLLLVGGEKRGISNSIIKKADKLVKIEYAREFRASLSAASAATMFAYEIMRQNAKIKNADF